MNATKPGVAIKRWSRNHRCLHLHSIAVAWRHESVANRPCAIWVVSAIPRRSCASHTDRLLICNVPLCVWCTATPRDRVGTLSEPLISSLDPSTTIGYTRSSRWSLLLTVTLWTWKTIFKILYTTVRCQKLRLQVLEKKIKNNHLHHLHVFAIR